MSRPAVSVLVPAFDQARYLPAALDAALSQSLSDVEIVVVDDGSTDETPAILAAYSGRVRSVHQDNRGLPAARNRSLAEARGELVAFLDADDVWAPDYLDAMCAALRAASGAVLAFGAWRYIDESGAILPQTVVPFDGRPDRLSEELLWRNGIVPSGVVARASAVRAAGAFDHALRACEDWDLWLRMRGLGPFVSVPRPLVGYRTHGENMTEDVERMEAARLALHVKHLGPLEGPPADWPLPRRRAVAYTYFVSGLAHAARRRPDAAADRIDHALQVWPPLAELPEFFYALAAAHQPRGYQGSGVALELSAAESLLLELRDGRSVLAAAIRGRWGDACLALARLALNAGQHQPARRYAVEALLRSPAAHKPAALRALVTAALPAALRRWRPGSAPTAPGPGTP